MTRHETHLHHRKTPSVTLFHYTTTLLLLTLHSTTSFLHPTPPICFSPSTTLLPLSARRPTIPFLPRTPETIGALRASVADDGPAGERAAEAVSPQTFREAEILGLRLMQQGQHQDALIVFQEGLKLPGSRTDILRSKTLNTSPVGGSTGGSTGQDVQTLDEFESQAAHYNIACAYGQLGKSTEAVRSLENAFKAGFDNYATARADPDLSAVQRTKEFEILMEQYDPKKGFPFSLFGGK